MSAGSFEAFNNGVLSTIRNLKELEALRDSLNDAKLSMGFNTKVFETEFTKYESNNQGYHQKQARTGKGI